LSTDILYDIIMKLLSGALKNIISRRYPKFAQRENALLKQKIKSVEPNSVLRVWFHSASMGEFEQAKPIIEYLKILKPDLYIIVSFFSPSGYLNQKDYSFADEVLYLPLDTKQNAKDFITAIQPDIAVFIRYEVWKNFLTELKARNIPTVLAAATVPQSRFLKSFPFLKQWTRRNYELFDKIFTLNNEQIPEFEKLKVKTDISPSSDPRFDRILQRVQTAEKASIYEVLDFTDFQVLVAGSTWHKDEEILISALSEFGNKHGKRIFPIIVPHEPTHKHIDSLLLQFKHPLLLSEIEDSVYFTEKISACNYDCLIVDSIGKLLSLYSLADFAYIGGAFGAGVHSVTEPAGFGIPISCGTGYQNSPDAISLKKIDVLSAVADKNELIQWFEKVVFDKEYCEYAQLHSKKYLTDSSGASLEIGNYILKRIILSKE